MSPSRRRLGYLIWGIAGLVIAVPEITAAFDHGALPFTTISEMTGHLEFLWNPTELLVIAIIVFALFSSIRFPPATTTGEKETPAPGDHAAALQPERTPGGRLTLPGAAPPLTPAEFDRGQAPRWFIVAAIVSSIAVALATLAAIKWWDDDRHFQPAYVLYGLIGLLWLVIPSLVAFLAVKDPPFPTMFRTVANLEDWLQTRDWTAGSRPLGPLLAWLVSFVILWGLVVLLLHITLYPFPNITHILNPDG